MTREDRRALRSVLGTLLIAVALVSSCDGGDSSATPSQGVSAVRATARAPSSSEHNTGRSQSSMNGRPACAAFVPDPSGAEVTRYDASVGSTWWVTYGVVTNRCRGSVRLGDVTPADPATPGIAWLGSPMIRAVDPDSTSIAAFSRSRLPPGAWRDAVGARVEEGSQIQVVALVRVVGSGPSDHAPWPVHPVTLTFVDPEGATGRVDLDPSLALCVCPLPRSASSSS
jgi:hypothetical protein